MLELPTDRLCKFFAVGGLLLAVLGGLVALDRFHEAELRRIDAAEKADAAKVAYARLSEAVDRQVRLSKAVRTEVDASRQARLLDDFWKLNDETERLKPALDQAIVDLKKHGDLNKHYAYMRRLWLYLGGGSLLLGLGASLLGFWRWKKQEAQMPVATAPHAH